MKFTHIDIASYLASQAVCAEEGLCHRKSLPCLSVVQAVAGSYEIGLDGKRPVSVGPGGIFITPAGADQLIIHHLDPATGLMRMRWLFLDARVNHHYRLEDVCRFPLVLPEHLNRPIGDSIAALAEQPGSLCADLARLYTLLDLLLGAAVPITPADDLAMRIRRCLETEYADDLTVASLAERFHISRATLFRKFQTAFGITPFRYLLDFRLEQASLLLEQSNQPVGGIGAAVGIPDPYYFSKCFREKYHCTPTAYRRLVRYKPPGILE